MKLARLNSERGMILPLVCIGVLVLCLVGIALLNPPVLENRQTVREVHKDQAFWLAEAGLERTLWNLRHDFEL